MRAFPWYFGAPLAVLAMTTAAGAQQAPAGPPPGLQNVPPPAQDAAQKAREEQYADQEARAEAARNLPQLQQNATKTVDAERSAAYEQARPVIRLPAAPRSSTVVVGLGTGARAGVVQDSDVSLTAIDVLSYGAFPLAHFLSLFIEGGVTFRRTDRPSQVPVRYVHPVVGAGIEFTPFTTVDDGARLAIGAAVNSDFAVGSGRIASEPKTFLTPSAHVRVDLCTLRLGKGCVGVGISGRLGVQIPLGADGTGTSGSDKARGVFALNIGPSVQC
jgi:hypothetical protein